MYSIYAHSFSYFQNVATGYCGIKIWRSTIKRAIQPFVLQSNQVDLRHWWWSLRQCRILLILNWVWGHSSESVLATSRSLWYHYRFIGLNLCSIKFLCWGYRVRMERLFGGFDLDYWQFDPSVRWWLCHFGWSEDCRRVQYSILLVEFDYYLIGAHLPEGMV